MTCCGAGRHCRGVLPDNIDSAAVETGTLLWFSLRSRRAFTQAVHLCGFSCETYPLLLANTFYAEARVQTFPES